MGSKSWPARARNARLGKRECAHIGSRARTRLAHALRSTQRFDSVITLGRRVAREVETGDTNARTGTAFARDTRHENIDHASTVFSPLAPHRFFPVGLRTDASHRPWRSRRLYRVALRWSWRQCRRDCRRRPRRAAARLSAVMSRRCDPSVRSHIRRLRQPRGDAPYAPHDDHRHADL